MNDLIIITRMQSRILTFIECMLIKQFRERKSMYRSVKKGRHRRLFSLTEMLLCRIPMTNNLNFMTQTLLRIMQLFHIHTLRK